MLSVRFYDAGTKFAFVQTPIETLEQSAGDSIAYTVVPNYTPLAQ